MIVCKFGGSIIKDKSSVDKIKSIINDNEKRKIIVLSAIGKSNKKDPKLTDLLFLAYDKKYTSSFNKIFSKIKNKLILFANNLNVDHNLMVDFNLFKEEFYTKSVEYIVSRGEYYTAMFIAKYLNFTFLPAENFLVANAYGKIDLIKSKNNLLLNNLNKPTIIPGYYYCDCNNNVALFKRGGGDVTGAILANILNAEVYENYTNINGIKCIDPAVYKNSKTILQLSYPSAYYCSIKGASVFSDEAIKYLFNKNIKTSIISGANPLDKKTVIGKNSCFFILSKSELFQVFTLHKKIEKSQLIQAFFNIFMLNKTNLSNPFYHNNKIYFKANFQGCYEIEIYTLTLFNYTGEKVIKQLKILCKKYNVKHINRYTHPLTNRKVIYLIGRVENANFLKELTKILK